jgi:NAD(P)-dependent dehydrogenase (short-subunit alcohol dehydrogenase family)
MSQKTVFVTGTNSGLGLAIVRLFATRGWNVVATMRRMQESAILSDLPNVRVLPLELTDSNSVNSAVRKAIEESGRIDVVINNAGYCLMGPLESTSLDQIRDQFETNVFGMMAAIKAFLPHLRANNGSRIINITSISADTGFPFVSAYGSSKAAIASLSETLNIELHDAGIQVKAVHPGLFATEIFQKLKLVDSLPDVYRPLFERFVAQQSATKGSHPSECAQVVYRAATDNRPDRVHYYAGRDATMVRRMKRLLGQEGAFRLTKSVFLNGMSRWMKFFLPRAGASIDVEIRVPEKSSE